MKKNSNTRNSLIYDAFDLKNTTIIEDFKAIPRSFNFKLLIKNVLLLLMGAVLTTFAFFYFINRAGLYVNGISAFAQVIVKAIFIGYEQTNPIKYKDLQALFFYPVFFVMNIPLIIWGFFKVGVRFSIYTCIYMSFQISIATVLSTVDLFKNFEIFGDMLSPIDKFDVSTPFIYASIGGMIYGSGIGLLFKAGGSSGGTDFISTFVAMRRQYSIATILRNTNLVIVFIAVFIDRCLLHKSFFFTAYLGTPYFLATIVYIFIGAFIMNRVYPKYMLMTVYIISPKIEEIRAVVYQNNYLRGGNIWKVQGLYSRNEYSMMMTTMSLLEYNFFKPKIVEIDPSVVMVATSARYMFGGAAKGPIRVDEKI